LQLFRNGILRFDKLFLLFAIINLFFYECIAQISLQFNWGEGYAERPIPTYLLIYFNLFLIYAIAIRNIWRRPNRPGIFPIILIGGLLFRAVLIPAQQIQEDDVYRYLWDGKVFAQGINPFKYAPEEVSEFKKLRIQNPDQFQIRYSEQDEKELLTLYDLKWENDTSLIFHERINHPDVPTIYPPLAQYVFRFANFLQPDSIVALRLVFLIFDILTLFFIVRILETLGKSRNWAIIYFWSPLILKETFNSTHLDIIGVSVLTGSLYFYLRYKFTLASLFLALGVVGKLYPIILAPIYLKENIKYLINQDKVKTIWKAISVNILVFTATVAFFYFPFVQIGKGAFEGLKVFTTYWQNNDSIFALILYFYENILGLNAEFNYQEANVYISYDLASLLSKATVALILVGTVLFFLLRKEKNVEEKNRLWSLFVIMGLVFLLSPVQNPWYLNWVVPFLCVFPYRSWILLTGLIGLYYMGFYFDYQDRGHLEIYLPWFEFAPFYLLLAYDYFSKKRAKLSLSQNN
jgi:alpha-1,6-mannosyltransferase